MTGWDTRVERVEKILRDCGWRPFRKIAIDGWRNSLLVSDGLMMHAAAQEFLEEFGGLQCELSGPGIRRALVSFHLEPMLCEGQGNMLRELCPKDSWPFPVGEVGGGNATLALGEDSSLYMLFEPQFLFIGKSRSGLAKLIVGDY